MHSNWSFEIPRIEKEKKSINVTIFVMKLNYLFKTFDSILNETNALMRSNPINLHKTIFSVICLSDCLFRILKKRREK